MICHIVCDHQILQQITVLM